MLRLPPTTFIHPRATLQGSGIILGDNVTVWPSAVLRADNGGSLSIGNNSNVQDGATIHGGEPKFPVIIGESVTIAHNAMVHGAEIEDFACVGIGAVVLDGCRIESEVILGAGAVAAPNSVLKSGWMYLGIPARPIRQLSADDRAWLRSNAEAYVRLGRANLAGLYPWPPVASIG